MEEYDLSYPVDDQTKETKGAQEVEESTGGQGIQEELLLHAAVRPDTPVAVVRAVEEEIGAYRDRHGILVREREGVCAEGRTKGKRWAKIGKEKRREKARKKGATTKKKRERGEIQSRLIINTPSHP